MKIDCEVFALREGEHVEICDMTDAAQMALYLYPISLPGEKAGAEYHFSEQCFSRGVDFAHRHLDGGWGWLQISAPTKEAIVGLIIESPQIVDCKWYELRVTK